jgi:hypothetical protein
MPFWGYILLRKICEDHVRNVDSKGSIFSIRKKTDGFLHSSMLADEDKDQ